MSKKDRAEKIGRAIRLTWDSLESHIPYTHEKVGTAARMRGESHEFHKKCVKDYAEVISLLSELY